MDELNTKPAPPPRTNRKRRDPRDAKIEVRIAGAEKARVMAKAKKMGVTSSELLRVAALGLDGLRKSPEVHMRIEALAPVFQDLEGVTNNLNHIARALNTDVKSGRSPDEARAREDVSAILGAISDAEFRIREILLTAQLN